MATTVHTPTPEELEELAQKLRALPELEAIGWAWDFQAQRVTLSQKRSRLSIHPEQVTLTFDTLTLAYYLLLKTGLEVSGIMAQMGPITEVPKGPQSPSGGPSELPQSHTPHSPRLL